MKRLIAGFLTLLMLLAIGCASRGASSSGKNKIRSDVFPWIATEGPDRQEEKPADMHVGEETGQKPEVSQDDDEGDYEGEDWDDEGDYEGEDWDDEGDIESLDYPEPIVQKRFPIYEALYEFVGGRTWVSYLDGKDKYFGLIDTNGILAFSFPYIAFDGRICLYYLYEDGVYVLCAQQHRAGMYAVNSDGETIFDGRGAEGLEYYYIGYGNGKILAVEHVFNFSENYSQIVEIDMTGEIVHREQSQLAELIVKEEPFDDIETVYMGNDLISVTYNTPGAHTYFVYDLQTHRYVESAVELPLAFYDGLTVCNSYSYGLCAVSVDDIRNADVTKRFTPDKEKHLDTPTVYSIGDGRLITSNGIYNYKGELLAEFPENWKVVKANVFSGGYAGIGLRGADKELYVTVIDENGKPQYDPMKVDSWDSQVIVHFDHVIDSSWHGFLLVTKDGHLRVYNPQGKWVSLEELDNYSLNYSLGTLIYSEGLTMKYDKTLRRNTGFKNNYGWELFEVFKVSNLKEVLGEEIYFPDPFSEDEYLEKDYICPKNFTITGKWKNTGTYTLGNLQKNKTVEIKRSNYSSIPYYCNLFFITYEGCEFYMDGEDYKLYLTTTGILLTVKIIDENHIDVYYGYDYLELTRVSN